MGDRAGDHRHQAADQNGADELVYFQRIHSENPVRIPGAGPCRGGGM
jgi:hypothetical protein